jgi:glycosyltransferase involved in cell wall biosynthesis
MVFERTHHRMCNSDKKIDVLFWADINPNKRGSFEDYIWRLSSFCKENGVRIKFALGNQISDSVRALFDKFCVDYFLLPSKELTSIWTMVRVFKNFKPKIIDYRFLGMGSPLIIVCKVMGVGKIIFTEHSSTLAPLHLGNGSIVGPLKRIKRRFFADRIDHFVVVSNFIAERLHKRSGVPNGKITVIYNGVDLQRFKPPENDLEKELLKKELFSVDQSVSVVTFIGQLIEEKGLLVYLESIQKLLKSHNDILFNLVGAGPLESRLIHWIDQAKNKMVRFLGFRDDGELILKASDILVVPSVWEEAFGLVIAEALACGVPVIGSRIGGIPEVLLDQKTGVLTTPGDVDELAKAIEQLVYDRELREYYSINGRKHAEKNFDIKMRVSKTICLYQNCLQAP